MNGLKRLAQWVGDIKSIVSLIETHRDMKRRFDTCEIDEQMFYADQMALVKRWIGYAVIKLTEPEDW